MGGGKTVIGNAVISKKDNFFAAGVWDGDCKEGDLLHTQFACCTGAIIKDDKIIFVTPNHMQEAIYSIRCNNTLCFSNSVPLLLAVSDSDLDENYFDYEHDFCSVILGFPEYVKRSPLKNGRYLDIYRCQHVEVDKNLRIHASRKYSGLLFVDFKDYTKKMIEVLKRIKENATSKCRTLPYGMISTISQGYDAAAGSTLAKKIGCDEVITFNYPIKYLKDKGTDIAKTLGYQHIYELSATSYMNNKSFDEAKAFCSGDGMMLFGSLGKHISNKLLFDGMRGDQLWSITNPMVNNDMIFTYNNGLSQAEISFIEYGLHLNTVMIHPPLLGADNWIDVAKISKSEEMKPFSVGNNYDRPIPRRIVEEAGVGRKAFGWEKKGGGLSYHYDTLRSIKRKMSPHSYNDLCSYKRHIKRNAWKKFCFDMKYYYHEYPVYLNYILNKLKIHLKLSHKENYMSSPLSSVLIMWGMDKVKKHYKEQI